MIDHVKRIYKYGDWHVQWFDRDIQFGIFKMHYDCDWIAVNLWLLNVQVNY